MQYLFCFLFAIGFLTVVYGLFDFYFQIKKLDSKTKK